MVAQTLAAGLSAKQTVQRAGFVGEKRQLLPGKRQLLQRAA